MDESIIDTQTSQTVRNENESGSGQRPIGHGPCFVTVFLSTVSMKAAMRITLMALALAGVVSTVGCSGDGGAKSGAGADPLAQWQSVENERKANSEAWSSVYVDPSRRCTEARELNALRSGLLPPSAELHANPGEVFRVYMTLAPYAAESQWNDQRKTIHFYLVKESITGDQQEIVEHSIDVSNIEQLRRADFGRLTTFHSDIQFHKLSLRPFSVSLNAVQKIDTVSANERSIWANALGGEMVFESIRLQENSVVRKHVCDQLSRFGRFSSLTEYPQISFQRGESANTRIFYVESQRVTGGRLVRQKVAQMRLRPSGELEVVPFVRIDGWERPVQSQGRLHQFTRIESERAVFDDGTIEIVNGGFQLSAFARQQSGLSESDSGSFLMYPISFRFVW